MLRLRAFRQTNGKIVKIQLHPTYPWLVTADNSDHVSVWNWEHRQAGGVDERRLVGTKLEKLAEGETGMRVDFVHFLSQFGFLLMLEDYQLVYHENTGFVFL
ncbi:hypothetical protein BHE74_00011675 [Ensete ventricosum]|nr:hypothetical protein GW17_00036243 [Ensete ventricosum]RWW80000.1 hypothetical protein BHE74_00011675 [Ensete ventricosum]RZR79140.1 hypothetical protein BHM03_00004772 [Ensete ventricosum]